MNYIISDAAHHSFLRGHDLIAPVLIHASTAKIREHYSKSYDGHLFFEGPDGAEKPAKLAAAKVWIAANSVVWAPIIEVFTRDPRQFFFQDGRHTFVALEHAGHTCIQIVVPTDRAGDLAALLAC